MEEEVVGLLKEKQLKISFAESCTGGLLAATLINVSGASAVIEESFITYSDKAKHKLLGVKKNTLKKHGAISRKTAKEMAKGCARVSKSDICVSVTGNAGPLADENKAVGLVYIGIFFDKKVNAYELNLSGDRRQIREAAVNAALDLIYDTIK
ncbi:MAG: CinA family protein [Lachnospiraceae bacterium]